CAGMARAGRRRALFDRGLADSVEESVLARAGGRTWRDRDRRTRRELWERAIAADTASAAVRDARDRDRDLLRSGALLARAMGGARARDPLRRRTERVGGRFVGLPARSRGLPPELGRGKARGAVKRRAVFLD